MEELYFEPIPCLLSPNSYSHSHQRKVEHRSGNQSGDGIDEIMSLNIHRGAAEEDKERQEDDHQTAVAGVHGEPHQDRTDAHMRTWKGCRGTFAGRFRALYKLIEHSVDIAWRRQTRLMIIEIIVHIGKNAGRDVLQSDGLIIECGADDGYENEDYIVYEERSEHYKGGAFKLMITAEIVVENHKEYHRIIGGIAHIEQLAEQSTGKDFAKEQGGLATEERLFPSGK